MYIERERVGFTAWLLPESLEPSEMELSPIFPAYAP